MKSLEELQAIRDKMKAQFSNRGMAEGDDVKIVVGMATCGIAAGARATLKAITDEVEARGMTNVKIAQTGCIGICKYEPIVDVIMPGQEKVTYVHVSPERVKTIIANHVINGNVVEEYTYSHAVAKA